MDGTKVQQNSAAAFRCGCHHVAIGASKTGTDVGAPLQSPGHCLWGQMFFHLLFCSSLTPITHQLFINQRQAKARTVYRLDILTLQQVGSSLAWDVLGSAALNDLMADTRG